MKTILSNYCAENRNNKYFSLKNVIQKIFEENGRNKMNAMMNSKMMLNSGSNDNKSSLTTLINYYKDRMNEIKTEINELKLKSERKSNK